MSDSDGLSGHTCSICEPEIPFSDRKQIGQLQKLLREQRTRIAALEEALRDAVAWNTKHTNCLLTGPDHTEHHPNIEAWTDALAYPNAQSGGRDAESR